MCSQRASGGSRRTLKAVCPLRRTASVRNTSRPWARSAGHTSGIPQHINTTFITGNLGTLSSYQPVLHCWSRQTHGRKTTINSSASQLDSSCAISSHYPSPSDRNLLAPILLCCNRLLSSSTTRTGSHSPCQHVDTLRVQTHMGLLGKINISDRAEKIPSRHRQIPQVCVPDAVVSHLSGDSHGMLLQPTVIWCRWIWFWETDANSWRKGLKNIVAF